jgi:alpha-L-rhamnosidase
MSYFLESTVNEEHGLLVRPPERVVLDHPDTFPMNVKGHNTAMNCLYYGALNSAAWIARNIMHDNSQAAQWEQRAISIKAATNKLLFSENDGVFKDGLENSLLTQQTQVYALKYGLVPEDKKSRVVDFIKSKGRSCEKSFSYWLLHTMFSQGQGQWALDYIRTYWGAETREKDFNGAWHEG